MSYQGTLNLMDDVGRLHIAPLSQWIANDVTFKFWGDNVDKKVGVRDVRSDHHGSLVHMYSIVAGRSRTPASSLQYTGRVANLSSLDPESFLPTSQDVKTIRSNLVTLVSRILTQYIVAFSPLSKAIPKHIIHKYSSEMALKSDVVVVDVLMKNETKHADMIDIMSQMQDYLGSDYPNERRLLSGGDQLTSERQVGAQRHRMDGDTVREQLRLLEPVIEDWHCLVILLSVS